MKTTKSKKILATVIALSFALSMVLVPSTVAVGATMDYGKIDLYGPGYGQEVSPLVPQDLDFTENPVDIPNPDRGPYRGRWQRTATPFGATPEVDHRVPVDENDVLYHGATLVGPGIIGTVEGDDIEATEFYNGTSRVPNYVGGSGISALPGVSFMTFDLCNFSSNAFLSREAGLAYDPRSGGDGLFVGPAGEARTGVTQPLTQYALDYIRGLLQTVRDGNGVAFVKFSYDGNGFNYVEGTGEHLIFGPEPNFLAPNNPNIMCNVPGHTDQDWIQYHIWQLKPILYEYEDIIMCVKTGMFGPWGEQHSSTVARNRAEYKKLIDAYLDAVPDSRILLTHVGGFMAWYNLTYGTNYTFTNIDTMPPPARGTPEARIGFFDDSYAANWDENGSLSETGGSSGTFNRYRNLTVIKNQNTIYQGEGGIGNNVYGTLPGAIIEAFDFRTTVLNMRHGAYQRWNDVVYNEANIGKSVTFPASSSTSQPYTGPTKTAYFDPVYDGKTGLEYMRDRLGYRLLLREACASEWAEQNGVLNFEGKIQNVGFGNVVNRKNVAVVLAAKDGSGTYTALTDLDARDWLNAANGNTRADNVESWRDLNFSVDMSEFGEVPTGEYDIYLKLNDPKETSANKRCIQFANHDIWNAELGANLIGQTTVIYDKVIVSTGTDTVSYISGDVEYTVSLENAKDVLAVELEFVIDGDMLAGKNLIGLSGFGNMNNILWVHAGDNNWKGTVTLALPSGTTKGLTSQAPVDIAKFIFTPKGFGNAAMTLTSARVVGLLDDTTKYVGSIIVNGTATTIIAKSKYDLNRDGVVDALDLGIMLLYCGFISDLPEWATQVKVNDAWGNGVTASMCDVNDDGIIDMLDLLDLFIHYTK
ncbi:MAG: DUF4832 domain-containing protein [Clostridiales bacterium]|nr:DUF4832 domain-containing protein [Clostridiales bacterium]